MPNMIKSIRMITQSKVQTKWKKHSFRQTLQKLQSMELVKDLL